VSNYINILFIGDIVGESGIKALGEHLPSIKAKYSPEFIIMNGENVCCGKGITEQEANILFDFGANIITTGNHVWENWKSKPLLSSNPRVLRPLNYPSGNAGYGYFLYKIRDNLDIAVLNLQGRTFMNSIDCPFKSADFALNAISERTKIIIVDFHADATAEKQAMGWHLDGRVSAVIGTHTHVPTADACILPKGTAYISDVGMTGPYDSVVGMKKEVALKRFILQTPHKFEIAENDIKLCAVHLIIDALTGQAIHIEQIIYPKFENSVYQQF
jgi:hypothetical protein